VSGLYVVVRRLLEFVVLLGRGDRAKELEILVLRHELSILRRQVSRPWFERQDRLLLAALSRGCFRAARGPRSLCGRRHCWPGIAGLSHAAGHTRTAARAGRRSAMTCAGWSCGSRARNSSWGYLRISGELRKLGVAVSATSVRNILVEAGLPPAPRRNAQSSSSLLRAQGESILACDFFTVDTIWLRRLYLLAFISIGSRRTQYFALTNKPDTALDAAAAA
jgi:hypothetical protein